MAGLADFIDDDHDDQHTLRVVNVQYTDSFGRPVVHLFGRDGQNRKHHVEIEGHRPSFFIRESDYTERLDSHYAVQNTERYDEDGEHYQSLHGEPLVRVFTFLPKQVPEVRDLFDRTWEADVFYSNRFLIDKDILTGVTVDVSDPFWKGSDTHYRVHESDVSPSEPPENVSARMLTVDIEVASEGIGFPSAKKAEWPVSVIATHDSYTDEYRIYVLRSESWEQEPDFSNVDADVQIYDEEHAMLADFGYYFQDIEPDLLGGWNSEHFDYPYLINRCRNLNVWGYQDWSPLGDVWIQERYGDLHAIIKGVPQFDLLNKYAKTQIHELPSKRLEDVAQHELGRGKVEMEVDSHTRMWKEYPEEFIDYAYRDVEAVIEIEEKNSVIDMHEHIREMTGTLFRELDNNINIIDIMVLREAKSQGIRLPTAVEPETVWFYGAFVFTPKAGLHRKVVYPDYSSLYPNMMRQINMSPETLVGTRADLFMSEYEEEDCVWTYVDTRPVAKVESGVSYEEYMDGSYKAVMRKKKDGGLKTVWTDDPEYTKVFFLKPEVKEGFVTSVVNKIMAFTDRYTGTAYEAAKRVRNSVYGVFGDKDSYGRGFRLFNEYMAEGITLGGRRVLKFGAEEFVNEANRIREQRGLMGNEAYLVGGDTDSAMTSLNFQDYKSVAEEAAEHVNKELDGFCLREFGVTQHHMYLEVESFSDRAFFIQDEKKEKGVGVKKRYVMTDGDGGLTVKGFHYVRSDVAQITKDVQEYVFMQLMYEDLDTARRKVYAHLSEVVERIRAGRYELSDLGIRFGIGKSLDEYGSPDRRPMPWYRGAKYANEHIYDSPQIGEGDKPLFYYVKKDSGRHYTASTAEDGDPVDGVSVDDANDIPGDIEVDREKMIEKTIKDPLESIFLTLDWDFGCLEPEPEQSDMKAHEVM